MDICRYPGDTTASADTFKYANDTMALMDIYIYISW